MRYNVYRVKLKNGDRKLMAENKTGKNAEAIINMAVIRQGVEDQYFMAEEVSTQPKPTQLTMQDLPPSGQPTISDLLASGRMKIQYLKHPKKGKKNKKMQDVNHEKNAFPELTPYGVVVQVRSNHGGLYFGASLCSPKDTFAKQRKVQPAVSLVEHGVYKKAKLVHDGGIDIALSRALEAEALDSLISWLPTVVSSKMQGKKDAILETMESMLEYEDLKSEVIIPDEPHHLITMEVTKDGLTLMDSE